MANNHLTKHAGRAPGEVDPMAAAIVYRMRRDALMIVSNMNRGRELPSMDVMKRQILFVQGQLCSAAIADPKLPQQIKTALVEFQSATVHESIEDRRGARRRQHRPLRVAA